MVEVHVDWAEMQLVQIEQMGKAQYFCQVFLLARIVAGAEFSLYM